MTPQSQSEKGKIVQQIKRLVSSLVDSSTTVADATSPQQRQKAKTDLPQLVARYLLLCQLTAKPPSATLAKNLREQWGALTQRAEREPPAQRTKSLHMANALSALLTVLDTAVRHISDGKARRYRWIPTQAELKLMLAPLTQAHAQQTLKRAQQLRQHRAVARLPTQAELGQMADAAMRDTSRQRLPLMYRADDVTSRIPAGVKLHTTWQSALLHPSQVASLPSKRGADR